MLKLDTMAELTGRKFPYYFASGTPDGHLPWRPPSLSRATHLFKRLLIIPLLSLEFRPADG